jgi:acetyl-CoA C-acetyltransferase
MAAPTSSRSAERIAKNRGITRADVDAFGAGVAAQGRDRPERGASSARSCPIEVPVLGDDGKPTGATRVVDTDQGIRPTKEGLAELKPILPGGIHTAGNSSQISDGACGVLYMSKEKASAAV